MADISKAGFYKSYYLAAKKLKTDDDRLKLYDAIFSYIFEGVELEDLPLNVDLVLTTIKPFIDADLHRKTGGAPQGNSNAIKQPKNNPQNNPQNNPKTKGKTNNVNVNVNEDVNDNVNVNVNENDINNTDIDTTFLTTKNYLKTISESNNLELEEKALDAMTQKAAKKANPQSFINERLNYILNKYENKSSDEKRAIFCKSFSWNDIPEIKQQKLKTKTPTLAELKAPKKCTLCGSTLSTTSYGYMMCSACKSRGVNVLWEFNGNDWKRAEL